MISRGVLQRKVVRHVLHRGNLVPFVANAPAPEAEVEVAVEVEADAPAPEVEVEADAPAPEAEADFDADEALALFEVTEADLAKRRGRPRKDD